MGDDEAELGLGIHGEPGVEKIALTDIAGIVGTMAARLAATLPPGGADHALILNNLGAVPPIEMGVLAHEVLRSALGPRIRLILGPGPYMTALNMNGFSLSLLRLDPAREAALTAPAAPPAWTGFAAPAPVAIAAARGRIHRRRTPGQRQPGARHRHPRRLRPADRARVRAQPPRRKGRRRRHRLHRRRRRPQPHRRPPVIAARRSAATARRVGDILASSMGGSSGVLLSIFFTAAGQKLADGAPLAAALGEGLDRIRFYGGAAPGDRTLIDALAPAIDALATGDLAAAARAAEAGAAATAGDGPRPRRPCGLPRRNQPDRHPRRRRPGRRRRLRRAQVSKTSSGNRASAAARRRAITS